MNHVLKRLNTNDLPDLYAAFFNRAVSGFLLFDQSLKLIDLNKTVSRILGIDRKDIKGKHFNDFSPFTKDLDFSARFIHVLKTGRPFKLKNVLTSTSAGRLILDIHAFRAANCLGVVMVDMTKFNSVVDEFNLLLYKLSHDMRSPNSAIRGLVNAAKLDTKDERTFYQYLTLINKEAYKLDTILKELNRTVQIKAGSIVVSRIVFESFVNDILSQISTHQNFGEVSIEVVYRSTKHFYCDRYILTTIFQNIIENALKYRNREITQSKLNITISDQSNGVNIDFEDNGIGIDSSALPHIFKMFFRGTSQSKGAGLGLFTVKNSVKALKGKISVDSKAGKGTKFSFYIPSAITAVKQSGFRQTQL